MSWDIPETSGTAPGPHRAHAATHVGDGRIFVFGGGDGPNYFNELFILDTGNSIGLNGRHSCYCKFLSY
jgi:hypothetical protein